MLRSSLANLESHERTSGCCLAPDCEPAYLLENINKRSKLPEIPG